MICDTKKEHKWKLWIQNARKWATKQTQRKRLIEIKPEIYKRKVGTTKKKKNPNLVAKINNLKLAL